MASSLFRPEAVQHSARQFGPGELLRLKTRWMEWYYWILLALLAAGVVASLWVQVGGRSLLGLLVQGLTHG